MNRPNKQSCVDGLGPCIIWSFNLSFNSFNLAKGKTKKRVNISFFCMHQTLKTGVCFLPSAQNKRYNKQGNQNEIINLISISNLIFSVVWWPRYVLTVCFLYKWHIQKPETCRFFVFLTEITNSARFDLFLVSECVIYTKKQTVKTYLGHTQTGIGPVSRYWRFRANSWNFWRK